MNVSTKTLATAVTASMILTGSSYAGTVTAIQDTYVHEQDNVNHGMSTDFRIKKDDNHDRIAYIEFDLSDYVGQTLDSASLTLQGIGAGSGDGNGDQFNLLVLGLDPSEAGSWSETVITGGSHPAASGNDTTSNNQMLDVTKLSLGTGSGTVAQIRKLRRERPR